MFFNPKEIINHITVDLLIYRDSDFKYVKLT